jgi:hypothetical protein
MKKKKIMNRFIVVSAILFLGAMNISAQVTIGKLVAPHAAAVLDLSQVPSRNLGLLMPRVELKALNSFLPLTGNEEKAVGMCIYNTAYSPIYDPAKANSFCPGTYVWNGAEWNRLGEPCQILPIADPVVSSCSSNIIVPPVHFMSYNLGADPTYDTPKKQMAYVPTGDDDARVYGGNYQWGRSGHEYAVNATNYTRYNGSINTVSGTTNNPEPNKFYMVAGNWKTTPDYTLWGNGELLAGQPDDAGGVKYTDDNYYQNTDWSNPSNNPCPTGWRVPTEDELERFTNYDCQPGNAGGNISGKGSVAYFDANSIYTLVKVMNGVPSTTLGRAAGQTTSGLAVYLKSEWDAAVGAAGYLSGLQADGTGMPDGKKLYDTGAPNPVLFFPAAGFRHQTSSGNLDEVNTHCRYWSSVPRDDSYSYHLYVNNNTVLSSNNGFPASGFSIRCCKAE